MPSKDPMLLDRVVLRNGGVIERADGVDIIAVSSDGNTTTITGTEVITPGEFTLTQDHIMVGNSSGVGADVAMSGDATIVSTGAVTVTGAAAAFNIGTNGTFTKEVNHTVSVTTSTSTNTAGGTLSYAGGAGVGTGNGGTIGITGGASGSGATGNGANAIITGGAALSSNGSGGSTVNTPGANTGTGVAGVSYTRGTDMFKMSAPAAKTTDATLTAAEILGGLITVNQGGAGTSTLTLPLGTSLQSALPADLAVGDCFRFSVINISTVAAEDCIMAGNTGTTYVGKTTINSNDAITSPSAATFVVRCTGVGAGAGTFSIYRVS